METMTYQTIDSSVMQTSALRQTTHWLQAAKRLSGLQHLASEQAWQGIDYEALQKLKTMLLSRINRLVLQGQHLRAQLMQYPDFALQDACKLQLLKYRDEYLKTETTVDFYTDAINTRTNPEMAQILRACDILCQQTFEKTLGKLGIQYPEAICYTDKGLGAAILKAGLRLWDSTVSPIAAIKITHHNMMRPTALIHEAGHQIAHITNWNRELSSTLNAGLSKYPKVVGQVYRSWASELAADSFAFSFTGYAAVAALHDVVCGNDQSVFAFRAHDPHPISYIRVLLAIEMCKLCYGNIGPWADMETAFKTNYNIHEADFQSVELITMCIPAMPLVARICMTNQFRAFAGQSLQTLAKPEQVNPASLKELENNMGMPLYNSSALIRKECLRLVALSGYNIALCQSDIEAEYSKQRNWMISLGALARIN